MIKITRLPLDLRVDNSCFQNLICSFLSQILYSFLLSNYFLNIIGIACLKNYAAAPLNQCLD